MPDNIHDAPVLALKPAKIPQINLNNEHRRTQGTDGLTRDLSQAKKWVRLQARGSERFGLVASSKALRLKPHAIDVRIDVDPVLWFLNDCDDTRSSFYLEDVATEFHVQGLELDWTLLAWNGELRFVDGCWSYHDFR